jgi:hypothetical protein
MSSSSSSLSSLCQPALFDNPCITDPPCRVDFDFIDDCVLPPLPDPIYDCDPPIPPIFEPPPDEFCPNISADKTGANVTVTYLNSNCGSSSSATPRGSIIVTETLDCNFILGLDLDIPIPLPPCPIFTNKTPPKVNVVFNDDTCKNVTPNTITITPTPSEDCEGPCAFDIDLSLLVPIPKPRCPIFSNKNPVTVKSVFDSCATGQESKVTVTSIPVPGDCNTPDTCEFTIDLDLFVPIPDPPCPKINSNQPVTVETYYPITGCAHSPSKFTVTTTQVPGNCFDNTPDTCQFDFNLDLAIPLATPPCPVINEKQTVKVATYYTSPGCSNPQSTFTVATKSVPGNCFDNTPDTCQFDFDLDLVIPIIEPPCPKFNDGAVTVKTYTNDQFVPPSTLRFFQRPLANNCNTPDQCEFDIQLDINVPTPIPPCPTIYTNVVNTNLQTGAQFKIDSMLFGPPQKNVFDDSCVFDVEFNITLPPLAPFVIFNKAQVIKTQCDADPELTFTEELAFNPTKNRWEVKITPELIWPVSPKFNPGTVTVSGGLGSGQITITGDSCNKEIGLVLTLNTAACSTGGGGGGGGGSPSSTPACCSQGCPCTDPCPPGSYCNPIPI